MNGLVSSYIEQFIELTVDYSTPVGNEYKLEIDKQLYAFIKYTSHHQHSKLLNRKVLEYPDPQGRNKPVDKSHNIPLDTLRPGEIESINR